MGQAVHEVHEAADATTETVYDDGRGRGAAPLVPVSPGAFAAAGSCAASRRRSPPSGCACALITPEDAGGHAGRSPAVVVAPRLPAARRPGRRRHGEGRRPATPAWGPRHIARSVDNLVVGSIGFFGAPAPPTTTRSQETEVGFGLVEEARGHGAVDRGAARPARGDRPGRRTRPGERAPREPRQPPGAREVWLHPAARLHRGRRAGDGSPAAVTGLTNTAYGQVMVDFKKVDRDHVLRALSEYDRRGADDFLSHHGFETSREYVLIYEKREYDSRPSWGWHTSTPSGLPARGRGLHRRRGGRCQGARGPGLRGAITAARAGPTADQGRRRLRGRHRAGPRSLGRGRSARSCSTRLAATTPWSPTRSSPRR